MKKCIPATFSGDLVAEASRVMLIDEVFEASVAPGARCSETLR